MVNVGLNHVRVFNALRGGESHFDGGTQIDGDNVCSPPARHTLRVTTFPASTFEHSLPSYKLGTHRCDPIEEIGRARVGKECRSRWSPYHEKKNRNTRKSR